MQTKHIMVVLGFCFQWLVILIPGLLLTSFIVTLGNALLFHWSFGIWFVILVLCLSSIGSLTVTIMTFKSES